MFMQQQGAQQATAAQQAAAQAQMQAAQEQIQAAQAQLDRAINEAAAAGRAGVSADTKAQVKEQIRAAFDAVRDAAEEARASQNSETRPVDLNGLIPARAVEIANIMGFTLVLCVVGFPLARAFGRWLDRRGATPPPPNREMISRLDAIEQAVESVAVEMERMSENQRFTARMLSERAQEPAGNFLAADRERVPVDLAGNAPVNARRG
ncbi:MAG: hypothetical protein ABI852_07710 [Gemmatimonadaceae bacterium]